MGVGLTEAGGIRAVEGDNHWWLWYDLEGFQNFCKPFVGMNELDLNYIRYGATKYTRTANRPKEDL